MLLPTSEVLTSFSFSVKDSLTVLSPSNLVFSNSSTVVAVEEATNSAILSTNAINCSFAATKSVSQLTSTIEAFLLSAEI